MRVPVAGLALLLLPTHTAFAGPCVADSDGDGVCDVDDVCPNRRDTPDATVSGTGVFGTFDTCAADTYPGGPCLYSFETEAEVTWTATETGTFRFVQSGGGVPALLLGDEADCGTTRLICDDPGRGDAAVELAVAAGSSVRAILSNRTGCGDVTLTVTSCLDADTDGVCDVCRGDVASGDSDADGVCDDLDACLGDDAVGDPDADGVCVDLQLTLDGTWAPGELVTLTTDFGTPGRRVALVRGQTGGPTPTPCGSAVDLRTPRLLTLLTSDPGGRAVRTLRLPAQLPPDVVLQAVNLAGCGTSNAIDPTP